MASQGNTPVDGILKQQPPKDSDDAPCGSKSGSEAKKKPRLQWDENNLTTNDEDKAKNPKMRIDEPKTPYHNGALSEAGSSTSGSVPQSPDTGGPSVTFVEDSRLAGFEQLELQYKSGTKGVDKSGSGPVVGLTESDSTGTGANGSASESSTPRSRQFAQKRKSHYHAEFHKLDRSLDEISDSDGDKVERESIQDEEVLQAAGTSNANGQGNPSTEARSDSSPPPET